MTDRVTGPPIELGISLGEDPPVPLFAIANARPQPGNDTVLNTTVQPVRITVNPDAEPRNSVIVVS